MSVGINQDIFKVMVTWVMVRVANRVMAFDIWKPVTPLMGDG